MRALVWFLVLALPNTVLTVKSVSRCYDETTGRPKRCIPEFENAAFNASVEASNTCGQDGPARYCTQLGTANTLSCNVCRYGDHPPSHLTDVNRINDLTWWQSGTMYDGLQYPNMVNITLHFGKTYDITYIRLLFVSPRPESLAIYKRIENGPWTPLQYFSSDCRKMYGLEDRYSIIEGEAETTPLCTSEYSLISPLTGGNIAFATAEGRQKAFANFDNKPSLHDFVSATDILIVLNKMNTFGDENYGQENVFSSYYYAISEIAIGARCKCNGHASACEYDHYQQKKICICEHNTTGHDCEQCLPFHYDQPWKRATAADGSACQPCNCNGFSFKCFYDKNLYETTGHGGHCLDCQANRDGPHCERCRDNYYLDITGECLPCYCNEIGSQSLQCNTEGKCDCKPGVTGDKCDACGKDFYDFSTAGCKECNCSQIGSLNNEAGCDQISGKCLCKENVEGKECQKCKPGYFNLDEFNEFGCTPCFCYGHSPTCDSSLGYSKVWLESMFARNNEKWAAIDSTDRTQSLTYNPRSQDVSVASPGRETVYFVAPERYLGDQRASYNQDLQFKLRVGEQGAAPSVSDIVIEGNGREISQTIFGQGNESPGTTTRDYKFKLHEHGDYGWQPRLSSKDFISILSNLTSIKIRGTYTAKGSGFLDHVKLGSAARQAAGHPAMWVERCTCPTGYIGQFCESCVTGYRHEPPNGGPFAECVPCTCNGHAETCDPDSGRCICEHNTGGENCERCAKGYYGNALVGTANDCKQCPCINNGACYQLPDQSVICLECPEGYAGAHCDQCSDGYYGQIPSNGTRPNCLPCDCNMNIDPNAINNCDRETGECLKCIYNTGGSHCDQCLEGFYGDPLTPEKGNCKPCLCNMKGTEGGIEGPFHCNQVSGQCQCKPNVIGTDCDQCKPGYYDLESGDGCKPCNCNVTGSHGTGCDLYTGQCICAPGVTGLQCEKCEVYHYGFFDQGEQGCKKCACDPIGSMDQQCNETGHCPCLENFEGEKCDRCKENKYDKKRNCVDCPHCYNLVQDEVNKHRDSLAKLRVVLENIKNTPVYHDAQFDEQLALVSQLVEQLSMDAKNSSGDDTELEEKIELLRKRLKAMQETLTGINQDVKTAVVLVDKADNNATMIRNIIETALTEIKNTMEYITLEGFSALALARNKSKESGQKNEQMTEIAYQARTLVNDQLNEAKETEEIAKKASETCEKAVGLLNQAKDKQTNATRELEQLSIDIDQAKNEMEITSQLTQSALDTVSKAYQEAFNFAVEINNLAEPKVDADAIRVDANEQIQGAERLEKEAISNEVIYKKLTDGIDAQLDESLRNLSHAIELQKQADSLLARADAAKVKAQDAVALGNKTLKDAQEVLTSLQDFDKKSQNSKEKATVELARIPDIKQLLREAQETTTNAKEALAGAVANAKQAAEIATKAQQQIAEEASEKAKMIIENAEKAKNDAGKMLGVVESLDNRIMRTDSKIKNLEASNDDNIKFTDKAIEKVGKAKNNTDEAERQVLEAMQSLESIIKELSDLSDIDEDTLKQLENRLQQAKDEFENANLNEKLSSLTSDRLKQQQQLNLNEEELKKLENEVLNIERISLAIPNSCYNKEGNLEP